MIPEVTIDARVVEIGGEADAGKWDALLDAARAARDSLGAVVECTATGVSAGWGAPVYAKLDDPVVEINLTPNRPDCTAIHGIARDLAATGLGDLKRPPQPPVEGAEAAMLRDALRASGL